MDKLNNEEQQSIDKLVNSIDHYRRAINEFQGMEIMTRDALRRIITERENPLKVAYTSDNRRICFDGNIVKIELRPR